MAVCAHCSREMKAHVSCLGLPFEFLDAATFLPVRYGQEKRLWAEVRGHQPPVEDCPDCRVPVGGYHHPGCDMEECPRCGGQAITCDCPTPE
jgi:hypothetical protein